MSLNKSRILLFLAFSSSLISCTKNTQIAISDLKDYHTIKTQPQFKGSLKLKVDAGSIQFRLGCTNDAPFEVVTPSGEKLYGVKTKDGAFVSVDIKSPRKGDYAIRLENDEQCTLTIWANPKIEKDSPWASEDSEPTDATVPVPPPSMNGETPIQNKIKMAYETSIDSKLYQSSFSEVFKKGPTALPSDFGKGLTGTWVEGVPIALPRALAIEEKAQNPMNVIKQKMAEFKFLPKEHNIWVFDGNGKLKKNEIPGIYELGYDRIRVKLDGAPTWNSMLYYDGYLFVTSKEMGPIPLIRLQ